MDQELLVSYSRPLSSLTATFSRRGIGIHLQPGPPNSLFLVFSGGPGGGGEVLFLWAYSCLLVLLHIETAIRPGLSFLTSTETAELSPVGDFLLKKEMEASCCW